MAGAALGTRLTMITLLVKPKELCQTGLTVEGPAYRHLFRARRLVAGDQVRLVDGAGAARWGRVDRVTRTMALLTLGDPAPRNEPEVHLELLTAIPRSRRLVWLVEKATEVGVGAIRLVQSQRSPRRTHVEPLDRLRRVAAAAVEQCQRSVVPEISGAYEWPEVPRLLEATASRWVLQPGAGGQAMREVEGAMALVVGPEGGWTETELEELDGWGCQPLGLGPTVLRVETAAVVGCSMLLSEAATR